MRRGDGRIAIVGAGLSGTALAVQLLRREGPAVSLIERSGAFGPGLAYGTRCERHLLNVRSGRMSLFPDQPDHFTGWLAAEGLEADPEAFARRADYGRYVSACLAEAEAASPGRLSKVQSEVSDVELEPGVAMLRLADGRTVSADQVVLALGNPPPGALGLRGAEDVGDRVIGDPWSAGALEAIGPDEDVFLVGTGLTAVDVLLALDARGWRGRAVAVSRRGLAPRTHGARGEHGRGGVPQGTMSAKLAEIRRRAEPAPWTAVMDGLRPHIQAMWLEAGAVERRRFLRHLRPWWDVHRHRMAPEIGAVVARLAAEGRLELAAGRLAAVEAAGEGLAVSWRRRGRSEMVRTEAGRLINCTGPQGDPSRAGEPLLDALLARGIVRTDPLRLGLDVDVSGRVLDETGRPHARLWAMGPLTRGALWEIVAVPEIREQAQSMAAQMLPAAEARPRRRSRVAHLEEVGESYGQHMGVALVFGARMVAAGAACMIHGLVPWMFTKTASRTVTELHDQMTAMRRRKPDQG